MQLSYLGADMKMYPRDFYVLKGFDPLEPGHQFLIRNAELAVGLPGVDAFVGLGVNIRIDPQADALYLSTRRRN